MSGFAARMAAAAAHERAVIDRLTDVGYDAEPFGQGQLTDTMREHLRRCDERTPVRWLPDIIAAIKSTTGHSLVVFIDAKAGERWRDTGNHDIETAALQAALSWSEWSGRPSFFVFSDWMVIDAPRAAAVATGGAFRGNGSGTPFVLLPRSCCVGFDDILKPGGT